MHKESSLQSLPSPAATIGLNTLLQPRILPLLLLAIVFLVHGQSLWHAFVWDDVSIMLPVEAYRQADLGAVLFGRGNGYEYLPLRDLTLVIDMAIWGPGRPGGFHFSTLLIFFAVGLAAVAAARTLFRLHWPEAPAWAPVLVGLVFLLHPLSVEPAHFVAARNTLLAACFALLASRAFLRLWLEPGASWLAAPAWLLCALLSKASIVGLPFLMLGYLLGSPRADWRDRRKILAVAACIVIGAGATLVHISGATATGVLNSEVQGFGQASPLWGLHRAGLVPFFYAAKWIWPWPLLTYYDTEWVQKATLPWGIAMHVVPLGLLFLCWRRRAAHPLLWFCVLWAAALLLPVLNILPTTPMVADRYLFPAQFGLGCGLAVAVAEAARRLDKRIVAAALAVLLVAWVGVDLVRGREWRDDLALTKATFERSEIGWRMPYVEALVSAGRIAEAVRVLEQDPDRDWSWRWSFMMGKTAAGAGRHEEAALYYQQAVSRGAGAFKMVWYHLGEAFEQRQEWLQAADAYRRVATATSPDPGGLHAREAKRALQRLLPMTAPELPGLRAHLAQAPDDVPGWIRLGNLAMQAGDDALAAEAWTKAQRLLPDNWTIAYNLGLAYARMDSQEAAYEAFRVAAARKPDLAEIENQLGAAASRLGRFDQARSHFQRALGLDPAAFPPAYNLLRLEGRGGHFEAARAALQEARKRIRNEADQESLTALLYAYPALKDAK